jgi:NAD(P)-dependent dehydrogenase (short-subunit alcohol dehydrogenase family)
VSGQPGSFRTESIFVTGELRSGRLAGKRALVTGAAAGLGKAIAHRFAEEGARVVVVDIQEQASHQVVESIRQQGGEAHAVVGDVGSSSQVERIVSATHSLLEGIDILVNNAGVIPSRETVVDTREEDWDKTLRVNAKGVFLMSRSVIPGMIRQGGGAIVNMSSVAGLVGLPIRPAYGASKGAVSILTRQMAVDFGKYNVRVNAINPSFVITDINREMFRRLKEDAAAWTEMIQQHPLGRLGEPGDVADAAVYLASDEARWVTGVLLPVDGGFTAR